MRLYNSISCTPVGSTTPNTTSKAKWSHPKAFVPRRPGMQASTMEPRTRRLDSPFHFDIRDDRKGEFFAEDASCPRMSPSTLSTQSTRSFVRTPIQRHRSFAMPYKTPPPCSSSAGPWYSPRNATSRLGRQSWSPRNSTVPFMVMPINAMDNQTLSTTPPSVKLQPRASQSRWDKKENLTPTNETQISSSLASMSLITEPQGDDDAFASPKPSFSTSSDDSSSSWLDFSSDGSVNPFQEQSQKKKKNKKKVKTNTSPQSRTRFSPIEKAKPLRDGRHTPIMTVKPSPVQRTMSAHVLFPTQHSRQAPASFMTVAKEPSAFAVPIRKTLKGPPVAETADEKRNLPATPPKTPPKSASAPRLAPPKRDVEPIVFSHDSTSSTDKSIKSEASSMKSLVELSKYTNMLKSGVPFDHVQFTMERDGVDTTIIGLAVAVYGSH